jgi:hypothetical protein
MTHKNITPGVSSDVCFSRLVSVVALQCFLLSAVMAEQSGAPFKIRTEVELVTIQASRAGFGKLDRRISGGPSTSMPLINGCP